MRKKVILIVVIAISSIGCHSNIESGYDIYEEEAFIAFIGGDYEESLKLLHELRENRRGGRRFYDYDLILFGRNSTIRE